MSQALQQINGNNNRLAPLKAKDKSSFNRNASPKSQMSQRKAERQNSIFEKGEENKDILQMNLHQQLEDFNINQSWFEIRLLGKNPERRGYHSSCINERKMYIYGGRDISQGTLSNLWMIDLAKLSDLEKPIDQQDKKLMWHQIDTHGPNPGAISHHSTVVFNDRMYLYGGSKSSGTENKNFYSLDLKSMRWEIVQTVRGQIPDPRDEHSVVLYENSMVVFGGFIDGKRTNQIYRYHFKDNRWEFVQPMSDYGPPSRAGHSAIVYTDSMFVFGGKDESNNKLDDLWAFNFSTYCWSKVTSENQPLPRSGHSASLYGGQFMLIFGGILEITKELDDMIIFDLRNKKWIQLFEEIMLSPIKQKYGSLLSSPQQSHRSSAQTGFTTYQKGFIDFMSQQQTPKVQKQLFGGAQLNLKLDNESYHQYSVNGNYSPNSRLKSPHMSSAKRRISTANNSMTRRSIKKSSTRGGSREVRFSVNLPLPQIELESPTSISMKNSFIIKNADPSFESYYRQMMRRKTNMNSSIAAPQFGQTNPLNNFSSSANESQYHLYGRVQGKRPPARDGHTGLVYGDTFIVFGGDRHHMPFNDLFTLDLKKEFLTKSHIFS